MTIIGKKETGYPSIDKTHLRNTKFWERHPFIPPVNISTAIDWVSRGHLNWPVINQRELTLTRGEYINDAKMVARALLQLNIKKGDIITISTPNLFQSLVIFKAANQIGAITTFINNKASHEELIHYLDIYKSPLLVTFDKNKKYAKNLINQNKTKHVINIAREFVDSRKQISNNDDFKDKDAFGYIEYHKLINVAAFNKNKLLINRHFNTQSPALILYTSGSTGEPKNMLFTNKNVIAALTYLKYSTHAKPYNKNSFWWMGVVPFMYPYGFACSVLVPLLGGFGARLTPDINPNMLNYYYKKDSEVICGSPAFLNVSRNNLKEKTKFKNLKIFVSGGDFLSEQQSRYFTDIFKKHGSDNVQICNGSGNGELLGCCTNSMGHEYRPDTVGKLVLGPKYLIINNKTNKEVKYGEPGELLVSGKHVFLEYYNNPQQTNRSTKQIGKTRYYCTGNYGYLDKDRFFTLVGRKSRFYINSAFNKVYCENVQRAISMVDVVEECAVVPIPNKKMLYVSKAYIVLKDNATKSNKTKEYIINALEYKIPMTITNLKNYEIPRNITFVTNLPRTAAEKIDYNLLEEKAKKESQNLE